VLHGSRGSLGNQVERLERNVPALERPAVRPVVPRAHYAYATPARDDRAAGDLRFSSGTSGFSPDGREYVLRLYGGSLPPAPWINVIANPSVGFLVSECGAGCTWAGNSQLNRLTPWANDPVADSPGEMIYLRDQATGDVWTPVPFRERNGVFTVRHGQGYSVFERTDKNELRSELCLFVPPEDPVKIYRLQVRNSGRRVRRLSATFFAEWVLGAAREQAAPHVATEIDSESGALLARNPFNSDFSSRLAFVDVSQRPRTFTADRTEFLGRNGSVDNPAALTRTGLGQKVGAGLDPCAALQAELVIPPGEERVIVFLLGQAENIEEVRRLTTRYRQAEAAQLALEQTVAHWDQILGAVQVHTPNPALDLLLNRWLLYQVLSCRVWGRSALYQSGGAFGFRDQLQDVLALVHSHPQEARKHILRAVGRQFGEGDVQHWWHPPSGAGVRTRFSDDFLWLPFATAHYVSATGDVALLNEKVTFLDAPVLRPEQEEDYRVPAVGSDATVYEHCLRAIRHGLRFGVHGLPLMGSGDWNDGMNRVGAGGKGESIWNAWFLLTILRDFALLCRERGDLKEAHWLRAQAEPLQEAVETHGWDGNWYRRAYFDDGTPLGSAQNDACCIDSLVQSWSALSGSAAPERAQRAMDAVDEHLVREKDHLILLFAPPFDQTALEPGYIKGYVPGIRENGGQYTHAAVWVVQALALLGRHERAMELLDLLNPILRGATADAVARYRVEPYVVAGDVYSQPPHRGRGGWTWYTGSAAWFYRVALETILGLQRHGTRLTIQPRVPKTWREYEITYRFGSATYHIVVDNQPHPDAETRMTVDGVAAADDSLELHDDGRVHEVRLAAGADTPEAVDSAIDTEAR
jgi:cyclic beta-1,2-glucan synthetase